MRENKKMEEIHLKNSIRLTSLILLVGTGISVITPSVTSLAAENTTQEGQTTLWDIEDETDPSYDKNSNVDGIEGSDDVVIENTENGIVVTKYEEIKANNSDRVKRAAVVRWGRTEYTNIAVSTGVAANAINTAFYSGIGGVLGIFGGIPGWAIGGLLNGAGWTQRGSKPGQAVANILDKNKNGWIGFYYQRGYDAAGRVVATRYSTL